MRRYNPARATLVLTWCGIANIAAGLNGVLWAGITWWTVVSAACAAFSFQQANVHYREAIRREQGQQRQAVEP